jgi:hypothetical protein
MKLANAIVILGTCMAASCSHQRAASLRFDQQYDIPCKPQTAHVRVGDDGFISFTYTISSNEVLEVQCKGKTTFVGQVVPIQDGRIHHVTAYDGTDWKMNSVTFTNEPNKKKESQTTERYGVPPPVSGGVRNGNDQGKTQQPLKE